MAQQMRVLMPPTPAAQDPVTTTLADICSYAFVTVPPTDNVEQAVRRMHTPAMRRVPVVDGGQLVDQTPPRHPLRQCIIKLTGYSREISSLGSSPVLPYARPMYYIV